MKGGLRVSAEGLGEPMVVDTQPTEVGILPMAVDGQPPVG